MTIGVWGDSITFGACDAEALGWVGRLRKSLSLIDDDANLYNFGVCGETSAYVLKRFQVELDAIEPKKVIFALGINDSKFPSGTKTNLVPLEEYQQNIQQLIDMAKKFAEEIVLVGPTQIDGEVGTPRGSIFREDEIVKYRDVLKTLAEANDLQFIDMFGVIDLTNDLDDGLHPSTEGYQKMFEKIKSELSWF